MVIVACRYGISVLLCLVFLLLPLPALAAQNGAQNDASARKELENRIIELRQAAAYTEAAEVAAELLELVRQDPEAITHTIAFQKLRVTMLEQIAGLSDEAQQELAEADGLQSEIVQARIRRDYNIGVSLVEKQLAIREKFLDPMHVLVGESLYWFAVLYGEMSRYTEAEPLAERSLAIWEQSLGPEHPNVVYNLNLLAWLYYQQGRYAEAEPLYERALAIREKALGPEHTDVAESLNMLVSLYLVQGRYAETEPLYERALAIREKALGPEHPDLATSLNSLAALYYLQSRYAEAEPLYKRALAIREKALGPEHPHVATSLNGLAALYCRQGRFAEAEPLHERALAIREKVLGPEHPHVATGLNDLAALYYQQGRYAEAEPLYERALAILEQAHGPDHPHAATNLSNLAAIYGAQGRFAEAEPLHERALAIMEKVFGPEHPHVASSLNSLAALYYLQGRYAEAEPLYGRALAIGEKALGPEHPDVATSLNSLATLYRAQGRLAKAEPVHEHALAIWEQALGPEHPHVATSLNSLATLYRAQGRLAEAEPLHERALAIWEQALGPEHPHVATGLIGLANFHWYQGRYAVAEPLYERALAILEQAHGPDHPHTATSLSNLAALYGVQDRHSQSLPLLARAAAVFESARLRIGEGLERATFQVSPYPMLAAAHLLTDDPSSAWPAVERDQGRVLADLLFRSKERQLTDPETAHEDSLRRLLDGLENRLTAGLSAISGDTEEEHAAGYQELRVQHLATQAEWSRFQREMAEKYPVTEGQIYALDRVQAALAPGSAYLGWLDFEARRDSLVSWAYVVRADQPVDWVRLDAEAALQPVASLLAGPTGDGGQSALERLARAHARNLTDRDTPQLISSRIAAAFCAARLGAVLPLLEDIEHLIVIPTGVMASIPVESLIDAEGQYLGDRFTISYIPSATIYTWLQEQRQARQQEPLIAGRTLLVGDPPFSAAQHEAMTRDEPPLVLAEASLHSLDETVLREARAGSPEALSRLPRLPGTRAEVMAIAALAKEPHKLIGPEACELELTQLATSGELKQFRTIHLATHALADQQHPERSCLILSQVGLPDALEQVRKGERLYDGRLTVQEILREWRLDADLVTLSACETGLGRQVRGEGVVGFAHAFLQVGARSLLVSLWPVEDRATALLMERFYANWWQRKMGKAEALREAKMWLREYIDTGGRQPYAHPFFWSAFVLIGERG